MLNEMDLIRRSVQLEVQNDFSSGSRLGADSANAPHVTLPFIHCGLPLSLAAFT